MYHLMLHIIPSGNNFLKMNDLQKLAIWWLELNGFIPNDNVEIMARFVKQAESNKVLEHLQKKSHHMHDNAFEGIWFCAW